MGWFDEQIRQRIKSDQDIFEDSIFNMASSVIGRKAAKQISDDRIVTKAALDEIIKYFGFKPKNDVFNDLQEEIDMQNILRPYGIVYRDVELDDEWMNEGYGPVIGKLVSRDLVIALLPAPFKGYYYIDYEKGKKVKVTKKVMEDIDKEAVCFYKPLPGKELGIKDLILYMQSCLNLSDIAFYASLMLIYTLAAYLAAPLVEFITSFVLDSGNYSILAVTGLFLISVSLSKLLIKSSADMVLERIEIKTGISVEAAVMNRVLGLPARFFRNYTAGELSSRINSVTNLCDLISTNLISMPTTLIFSFVYLAQIKNFAPELVLPAIVITFVSLLFSIVSIVIQAGITRKILQYDAHEDGITYAFINGIQKIRLAGAEKRAFAKWANDYNDSANLNYSPPTIIKLNKTINIAIGFIGTMVLYNVAARSNISASEYMAFNTSFGLLTGAMASISGVALSTANIKPILTLAEPILHAVPEVTEGKRQIESLSGSIEIANVHFRYDDESPEVLKGISFKIKAGEYVAIVGKTGCGKSTLMRLLLGFETPDKGAIYYDGKETSKLDMTSLRRKIGSVTQNGSLFQGDIYSNIVITNPLLTVNDAWEAAEIAGIADDIREMPMGMNTIIAEGQGGISGGQKQRLMIARAVAPKPRILMLDEATSALDNITQKKVSNALDGLKCTRIVIAHRLSTIRNCDRILVMDDGKIVEEGSYDTLIAKDGFFAELVKRQQL
ncbi:ATP-binding cassette domain-containing protein [Butyrivibrio sp. INlla14]|uniref:ATP-binding cassette domain-containing protein n=1 Tax=Butyrivibrio sp. INlla14 TaxID=1520808 RepID=UPI00087655C6|nr:ATP-binding cassette domain-containing protein [Butyrivibrio sp. INlla14]SCY65961.1 NHLM bacteriocin system ABC transporter, ATP-binding protein [Butyrivibrio sp. INlla14]